MAQPPVLFAINSMPRPISSFTGTVRSEGNTSAGPSLLYSTSAAGVRRVTQILPQTQSTAQVFTLKQIYTCLDLHFSDRVYYRSISHIGSQKQIHFIVYLIKQSIEGIILLF